MITKEKPYSIINRVINFSLSRRILIIFLVIMALAGGIFSFTRLPRDIFPDITLPVFNIVTQNMSMSQEEIEMLITRPVETSMNGLPGITSIRSTSLQGISNVNVSFSSDIDYYLARQFVAEKIPQVMSVLPEGTATPVIASMSSRLSEIYQFTLKGPNKTEEDLKKLRELAEFQINYQLMTCPNISKIINTGGYLREYQILLDPYKLGSLNLTLKDVIDSVKSSNEGASGSFISLGSTEMTINGQNNRIKSLRDLADSVIVTKKGNIPVLLKDAGDIIDGYAIRRGIAAKNLEETVNCNVMKQFGADTVSTTIQLKKKIEDINSALPQGYKIEPYYDQTELIESSLQNVQKAILEGAAFVIFVLIIFLGNIRSAFIVALIIPVSVVITFMLMYLAKLSINTMSLGGIAIGITLLVDASIIAVENTVRRLSQEDNKDISPLIIVSRGISEVAIPIFSATIIIIAVFFPLFMLGGIEGKMFNPLSFTVCSSMGVALLLTLTMTPVLSSLLLRRGIDNKENRIIKRLKMFYTLLLNKILTYRKIFIVSVTVTVLAVFSSAWFLSTEFMPEIDEGALVIQVVMPPDISLSKAIQITTLVQKILEDIPEITQLISVTGRPESSEEGEGINQSEIYAMLIPPGKRHRNREDILKEVRSKLNKLPGVAITIRQPFSTRIEESISGTPATISVKLFGDDISTLIKKGKEIEGIMERISGVEDLKMEQVTGVPQLKIDINRSKAARYGITSAMLSEYIKIALGGEEISQVWAGKKNYGIFLRLMDEYRSNPERLEDLLIDTSGGTRIPIGEVAHIYRENVPNQISHEALTRKISIDCSVSGGNTGGIVKTIKSKIKNQVALPEGYYVVYGGEYENQEKAFHSLFLAVIFALLLVFIIIFTTLNSLPVTLLIMISLPVALAGGIIALFLTGTTLNVASAIGFIGLLGIAVQNSLVLFNNIREFEVEGIKGREAIIKASVDRVRPKLMTAFCAILGLIPLVISNLQGTEMQKPMAIVIIGGLFTSTIFVLFVLPVLYDILLEFTIEQTDVL